MQDPTGDSGRDGVTYIGRWSGGINRVAIRNAGARAAQVAMLTTGGVDREWHLPGAAAGWSVLSDGERTQVVRRARRGLDVSAVTLRQMAAAILIGYGIDWVMTRRWKVFLFAGVAVILLTIWWAPRLQRFLEIDDCLDLGGRWDYDRNVCEH
jgi:hypothetical protein